MNESPQFRITELEERYRGWAQAALVQAWGSSIIVNRGQIKDASQAPGLVALEGDTPVGLATYRIEGDGCELLTLNALVSDRGIGSALLSAVRGAAISAGCHRLWVVTTNDNTPALRFYQRRGFILVAVRLDALVEARKLKPEIPKIGLDGIPLRDEIELEMRLA
jgi:ribosomal protein S18 acetylase RimI-like enzyme